MIRNHPFDQQRLRGLSLVLFLLAITLIYFSMLFRKDAYLILGIVFTLYGILKFARWLLAGVDVEKLDRILFYGFILFSLFPLSYLIWLALIQMKIISRY